MAKEEDGLKPSYKLLGILQEYAPKGSDQQQCSSYYNDVIKENPDDELAVAKIMCGVLYDGLAYGNWIWDK